jgi:hypothetical protein
MAVALVALGLVGLTFYFKSKTQESPVPPGGSAEQPPLPPPPADAAGPSPDAVAQPPPAHPPASEPGDEEPAVTPPVAATDFWDGAVEPGDAAAVEAALRKELKGYSLPKELQPLLQEPDLACKLVAAIDEVASGDLPGSLLPKVRLTGKFEVERIAADVAMAAKNAQRSVQLVTWFREQESGRLAASYHVLEPGFEAIYRRDFSQDGGFRQRVRQALLKMQVDPPLPTVSLKHQGGRYLYVAPAGEALPAIQKLIIRSGRPNANQFRSKLAETQAAIAAPR